MLKFIYQGKPCNKTIGLYKRFRKNTEGATAAVFAICLPIFIGGVALMVEATYWQHLKSELQNTADMSALAGAYEYMRALDVDVAEVASYADADDNSFDFTQGNLTVNIPPQNGAFAGELAVEVIINQNMPTFFSPIFLKDGVQTTVTAVVTLGGASTPACVVSLASNGTGIDARGNIDVDLRGCALHSNSPSDDAINFSGSAEVSAECLSATGGIQFGGSASHDLEDCASPLENQSQIPDPFADISVPSNAASLPCNNTTTSGKGNNKSVNFPNPSSYGGTVKICDNQINLSGDVVLEPGTYILDGTDLNFGSHASLQGDGVTLIFMNDAEIDSVNGNNSINLSAPTTGPYAGVVIYGDRDTLSPADWKLSGNADISIEGAVYLPTIDLEFGGGAGSNSTRCTLLVANVVEFRGNSGLENDCADFGLEDITGPALTTVELVE